MKKETIRKLLLSNNLEDNKIGMSIVISQCKTYDDIKWALFKIVRFEGWYLQANIDTNFTERTAQLILNHPFSNT